MTPAERIKRQEMIKKHRQFMSDKGKKKSILKKKAETKRKVRNKPARDILLKHFGLHESTSNVGICHYISEKYGIAVPGERKFYRKVMKEAVRRISKETNIVVFNKKVTPTKKFFDSKQWRELRYLALKQSGGCCQLCGAKASDGVQIHVDHIKPRSKFPGLELNLNNLQVLCGDCNMGKSNIDDTNWRQHWESI